MSTFRLHLDGASGTVIRLLRVFDKRALRDRVLMTGAAMALTWALADNLWLASEFNQYAANRTRRDRAAASLVEVRNESQRRTAQGRATGQQLRSDIARLREKLEKDDTTPADSALMVANDMLPVLDRLMAQFGGLRLRTMKSIGPVQVGTDVVPTSSTPSVGAGALYRHGVDLTVEGSYAEVRTFAEAIEQMPQRLLWGGMQLRVEQYPKVVLTLRLYTLSQDRDWLRL